MQLAHLYAPSRIGQLLSTYLRRNGLDLAILVVLTLVAALPRLVLLGDMPPGLHGDEADAGLEARQILAKGGIGPYSFQALGVPAGTFYWAAAVFAMLGESVFTLRLAFAILGIASISLSYLAFRVMFGRGIAILATLLLAVSAWHLHYSRIAFVPIGWLPAQMATLLFLFLGLRYGSTVWFALAGAALGAGMYTNQAFPIFVLGLGMALLWLAASYSRHRLRLFASGVFMMLGVALLVALPLGTFAGSHPDVFLGRYRRYSVAESPGYKAADSFFERARYLAAREGEYIRALVSDPIPDAVDAAGVFPLVNPVALGLLSAGLAIALWRARSPPYAAALIITIVIGIGPALVSEGFYRRTLGLTPLLAAIAALPLSALWDEARKRSMRLTALATLTIALAVGSVAAIDLSRYFTSNPDHPSARWVYGVEMAEASRYIARFPKDTFVYFYSSRWSFDYDVRQFLAPEVKGEDRS
ncbi:MAG: glycosyltransferase family 39 protein, partial [Chloroflexota bacterium]|nr:glycosyltransferase family 39 protein [Chloroflexota bacterium]